MKKKNWHVYTIAPILLITLLLYIFFISEIEISDVLLSIKLKIYIFFGFVATIVAVHLIEKKFFRDK